VTVGNQPTLWQRWVRQPQKTWLRKALFQVHLWSGIALGLYILMISVTGSVLVYWNELLRAATPEPIISAGPGPRLTDVQLAEAAVRSYPGYQVVRIARTKNLDRAVDVWLSRGDQLKKRMFDPRTGCDLGDVVPTGIWVLSKIQDIHDNLVAGQTGRKVNGLGAVALLALAVTGLVIWWPGMKTWRRSLILPRRVGWKRFMWHLHSMVGFWTFGSMLVFGFSGIYLSFPEEVQDLADRIQPATAANAGVRAVDRIVYWLAYLHFGRINGIGIPCHGPGLCDQTTKATWALFGLVPAIMLVTGAIMWWNRVIPRLKKRIAADARG
jgi:uncharacterized iron-regulated membrane protein